MRNFPIATLLGILGLAFAGEARAQPAKTTLVCSVRSISPASIVRGKEAEVTINVRGCPNMDPVSVISVEATDITFTLDENKTRGNRVVARVKASPATSTDTTGVQISWSDNTRAESPERVRLRIFDPGTALVNDKVDRLSAIMQNFERSMAEMESSVETVRADLAKTDAKVEEAAKNTSAKIEELRLSRPTWEQVTDLLIKGIEPLILQVRGLEEQVYANTNNMVLVSNFTDELALLGESLANTEVKKGGFLGVGGKRRLNMEAAASAERIRQNLASMKQANSARAGVDGK